jgi:hypothetical protein
MKMVGPFQVHLVYSHNVALNGIAGIEKADVKYFNRNMKKCYQNRKFM